VITANKFYTTIWW